MSQSTRELVKHKLTAFENRLKQHPFTLSKEAFKEFKEFKLHTLDLKGLKKWIHLTYTTVLALIAALAIRQMWFELYKVPTGSMRPTIKELDHLTVSKLNFSINIPFTTKHFYFDPKLVERSSICVFTSENMDVPDSDTLYFYLIPGKKLLVKRLLGKPGDTLYFYGGNLYGFDQDGHDLFSQLNPVNIEKIDHIPFLQWFGDKPVSYQNRIGTLYHMNVPYVNFNEEGSWSFAIPSLLKPNQPTEHLNMSSYWGLDQFATARVLNQQTKNKLYPHDPQNSSKGLFLEFKHHPRLAKNIHLNPSCPIELQTSLLPLDETLAKKLFTHLYTARFEVKHGILRRYGSTLPFSSNQLPKLHHIPDGTYEFYYGKAYRVFFGGLTQQLPPSHPIYRFSNSALEIFFNLGIEFNTYFTPGTYQGWAPPRYSYFKEGDLYVMGLPFLSKNSPYLESFIASELQKPTPFIDEGVPSKEKISKLGLKIPEKSYLMLGDNHAQSGDSRVFGFVPEQNLKGCPDLIFWPFGSRFGPLPQAISPLINLPRAVIWSIAWIIMILWLRSKRKLETLPQDLTFLDR